MVSSLAVQKQLFTFMLRSTADAKRVPFEISHCWYVDVDVIACFIGKLPWFIDDQMDHLIEKKKKKKRERVPIEVNIRGFECDLLAKGVE